jgi:cell wall-associated NlpC family hydrolase
MLFAPHYARPLLRSCGVEATFLHGDDKGIGEPSSELVPGEEFAVLEYSDRMAWGYCRWDHYVGYVDKAALVDRVIATHIVATSSAPVRAEARNDSDFIATLPMASRLAGREDKGFLETDSGFIALAHVRPVDAIERDPVGVAERLLGAPYLWGGRTFKGVDCSGLVQLSLGLCGIHAPRDSDQQRVLGTLLPSGTPPRRGDLVFFEGHVGLMSDETHLIHATMHSGKVVVEQLEAVAGRTPIVERRRL